MSYGKKPCPRCRENGNDASGNNLHCYGEGQGSYCFACGYTIPSDKWLEEHGDNNEQDYEEEVMTREMITEEENEQIKGYTGTDGKGFRGIRKEINSYFGVRYQYSEETGEPIKEFVPTTINGELTGYKTRVMPKDFSHPVGKVGKECDLIGQFRFKTHSNTCLIVGGEIKQRAAYQMLVDSQKARGKEDFEVCAVVSPTVGENGAWKQIQAQYAWLSQFKKIIVAMDNDKAGQEANEAICKVLPKGKAFIMKMSLKDADDYIKQGKERDFVNEFWKAKAWSPAGLYTSDAMYEQALEYVSMDRLPMPTFMAEANRMLGGGIPRGFITMWAAASSIGKTTLINQCLIDWTLNNENELFGILSLEATAGEYATNLISCYVKTKFATIQDKEMRVSLMSSPEVQEAAQKLFTREDGTPRFVLCDDRGDTLEAVQSKMEEMVRAMGVTVLVCDVTSDLLAGLDIAKQEEHMAWQKKFVKETGVIIHNVVHIRKAGTQQQAGSRGAEVTDESIAGSSSLYKSAGVILALVRDKMAEDDIERNTTKLRILKNRSAGITGAAGELYYDGETHTLHNKDEWMSKQHGGSF